MENEDIKLTLSEKIFAWILMIVVFGSIGTIAAFIGIGLRCATCG